MRAGAVLREAWRNIATGTTGTVTLALLLSAASVGLAAADLLTVNGLIEEAEDFQKIRRLHCHPDRSRRNRWTHLRGHRSPSRGTGRWRDSGN